MTTLFEDVRLMLRQVCASIGLSGTAATVVPLLVIGVALNAVALSATGGTRIHKQVGHQTAALRCAARTELKIARGVLSSTLKKMSVNQRRWCVAQQWMKDLKTEVTEYRIEVGVSGIPAGPGKGCDVTIASRPARMTAIAFVEC
jgi:hypothetical protein